MSQCASCKGTRQIVLAYSVVDCLDCAIVVSESTISPGTVNTSRYNLDGVGLPAAPMAKCAAEFIPEFKAGDRIRHSSDDAIGIVRANTGFNEMWNCHGYVVEYEGVGLMHSLGKYMKKDTI
jgi:hypothetical protein